MNSRGPSSPPETEGAAAFETSGVFPADEDRPEARRLTCPACGSASGVLIGRGVLPSRLEVRRCRGCGLDFFERGGEQEYWETEGQGEIYEEPAVREERQSFFEGVLDRILNLTEAGGTRRDGRHGGGNGAGRRGASIVGTARLPGGKGARASDYTGNSDVGLPSHGGTLLDVGAGKGEFARLAAGRGFRVSLVEPSRRATAGLEGGGFEEVFNCRFEDFRAPWRCDCVTLLDFLEHTRDPAFVLRQSAACLAPGGLLVVLTPDGGSALRRWLLSWSRRSGAAAGLLMYLYYLPHVSYLGAGTLRRLSGEAGLEPARLARTATPRRFLLSKLERHYSKYPGNRAFAAAVKTFYPLAAPLLANKLLFFARRPR